MKKIFLLLIAFAVSSVTPAALHAQTYRYNLDSLRAIIDTTSNDSIKCSAWSAMVFEFMCHVNRKDADSVLALMKAKADNSNSNNAYFKYYASYADYYLLISRHDSSTMMSEKARHYMERFDTSQLQNKTLAWKFYYKLGYAYDYVHADSAVVNHRKAIQILGSILQTAGDSSYYIRIMSALSLSLQKTKNYDEAIDYARQGMLVADALKDSLSLALLHNIQAGLYELSNAYDEAIIHFKQGIEYANMHFKRGIEHSKAVNVDFRLNQLYFGLGSIYFKLNLLDSALVSFEKSLFHARNEIVDIRAPIYSYLIRTYCALDKCSAAKEYVGLLEKEIVFKNANYEHFDIAHNMGIYYLEMKDLQRARSIGDFMKASAETINTWDKKAAYFNYRSDVSAAENKFEEALRYYKMSELYADSVEQQKIAAELTEVKSKYEAEKKDNQIQLLEKDNALHQASVEKQKISRNYAYGGIVALVFIGGFTYNRYRQRKKLSEQLQESLHQLKSTQQQVLKVEKEKEAEKLRVRISRDIHDDIGSHLSKMALHSELISAGNISDTNQLRDSLQSIADNSRTVINSIGEIVWAVSPERDSLQSLLDYMRKHLDKFLSDTGIQAHIDFPATADDITLMPDVKRNLFLVFKEAVNNTLKYAQAKNIFITFKNDGHNFELTIRDDGKGFVVEDSLAKGNGMNNMQERMKQINGTFSVQSAHGSGCAVIARGLF